MKRLIITIALAVEVAAGRGQISLLRYNDNFGFLKADTISKKGYLKLKYMALGDKTRVSVGGEIREQLQYYGHINFGDLPPSYPKTSSWQLWHRALVHANIEAGNRLRIFTQLGSTFRFINPNPLAPEIEEDQLSIHQAFLDFQLNPNWVVRLGRQEMGYGSHRLITFREGPNNRLSFDAALVRYHSPKSTVDMIASTPVISEKGVFDDRSFKDLVAGVYATEKLIPGSMYADFYFLYFNSNRRKYNYVAGREKRNSVGFRLFSEKQLFNYETEATWQFGKFNELRINAYSLSADVKYKLITRVNLLIGLGANYVSGDRNPNDGQLNTYNLLFSKPQYGLAAPIGATNLLNLAPYIRLNPSAKSNIYMASNFMWRQSVQDGTYSPIAIEMRPNKQSAFTTTEKKIGTLLVLETNYFMNTHYSIAADVSYLLAGNYVKATGKGKDISYFSFKAGYKF